MSERGGCDVEEEPLLGSSDCDNINTNSKMGKSCCAISTAVLGVAFLICGIVLSLVFDPIINKFIDKEIVLRDAPDTEFYKTWKDPPIKPELRIFFFNLTNQHEFIMKKSKPIFNEVGPYVYIQIWNRVNVTFHENNTVSYAMKKTYHFDRKKSVGPDTDVISTLNVPVTLALERMARTSEVFQLLISSLLITLNETAFVNKTVHQLVWGYEDPLLKIAKRYMPSDQQVPFTKFGFFLDKNATDEGLFNVFTGDEDVHRLASIDTFNHMKMLPYWKTKQCNMLNGSDGSSYNPYLTKESTTYFFNGQICRSIPLEFKEKIQHQGVETYRFVPPSNVFGSVSDNPENSCYCLSGGTCMGSGLFNTSVCNYNLSIILSWPHFYQADPKYLNDVVGLKPDPEKHSFFADIVPRLGIPLSSQARLQINFRTFNLSTVKIVKNMSNIIFPVLWFENGVEKMPASIIDMVKMGVVLPAVAKGAMIGILLFIGFVMLIACSVLFYRKKKFESKLKFNGVSKPMNGNNGGIENPGMAPENPD